MDEEIEEQNIDAIEQILRSIVELENKVDSGGSGGSSIAIDETLTEQGKAADAKAVGDRLDSLSEEIANLPSGGSGLTTAQVNALDGMFKVAAYDDSKDVSGAYAAFKAAFGLVDSGATTYTITAELVNVTSSNSATSITEGASYIATLTAADGYKLDAVSVLMGGVDITSTAYAGGVVTIAAVTGNVEIVASASVIEVVEAVLPEDGLLDVIDIRNITPYVGNGETRLYATNEAGYIGTWQTDAATEIGDYGVKLANRDWFYKPNGTIDVDYTVIFMGYAHLFTYKKLVAQSNINIEIYPTYLNSSGVETKGSTTTISKYSFAGYTYVTIRVEGSVLSVFLGNEKVAEFNGENYENFGKWVVNPPIRPASTSGYCTEFVAYNRALTDIEVVEALAYLKTKEMSA